MAEENKSILNWIGKQKDKENGLGDHGVRKYEYETGRFTSIDPLWNKYYGWTPYQYSMNSPVGLVDFGGMKVQALDNTSREAIIGSVESQYEDFVQFGDDGFVKASVLRDNLPSDIDVNSNAHTLMRLAENPKTAVVSTQKEFNFKDKEGNIKSRSFYDRSGFYDEETTLFKNGYTVFPDGGDAAHDNKFSLNGKTNIFLSPYKEGENYGRIVAHELFVHFRFYLMNLKSNHDNSNRPNWQDRYERQSGE